VPVHLLHHGRCFDGAVSAALFADFYRRHVDGRATFVPIPKHHREGDPFDPGDFGPDVNVVLDFRYTQHTGLHFWFDHHRSAFQLPGDREHYAARSATTPRYHDDTEPSCAGFMVQVLRRTHGYDASAHDELIDWATRIDSADFVGPEVPVEIELPAMKLAAYVQALEDPDEITDFLDDLLGLPLAKHAEAPHVVRRLEIRLASHRKDIVRIGEIAHVDAGVLEYDLLSEAPRVLNHFIPYYHHPKIPWVVGIYRHVDGDLRLSVGYNPWLPPEGRGHDLARLCERFGGGGHPYVAGISLPAGDEARMLAAKRAIVAVLRGEAPPP
jgi:hypothetical protein